MKYLIAGLGNIGVDYENTRHNIGFDALDELAGSSNVSFSSARYADQATVKFKGRTLILIKPTTYMNLSGKAVHYWLQHEKIPLDRLLVITDDLALPFGTLRLKTKGSDGGHNGLKNIQQVLGTPNYSRLRFGIGSEFPRGHQVDFVLSKWSDEEQKELPGLVGRCSEIIKSFVSIGPARTMNLFN